MNDTTRRLAPHFSEQLAQTLSLGNDRLFAVALILAIAPLWIGRYLPMVDIPQHAAQIAALRQMWEGNETFTQLFQVNWFTPYLLGYLLLYLLSLLLPITVATQIVVSLSVAAVPLLTGYLLRAAGGDERYKWLAIPAGFGFAFYWGFLSFIVAVPFGLLFLIQTIRFVQESTLRRGLGIAAFAVFLFFCHVIVLGFASLMALTYVCASGYRDPRRLVLRLLPYTAPLPLLAVWLFATYSSESSVRSNPVVFGPLLERFIALLVQPAGRDYFSPLFNVLVTGSIVLLPGLIGSKFSRRPERWLPFALGLLTFLVAPHYVLATAYFYQRLGIFLVPLWLMAWDPPAGARRRLDWIAMLVVMLWTTLNIGRFAAFARETQSFDAVIKAAEPGRKAASMVFDRTTPLFGLPVYMHFPAWYQATHRGIVDFNFADFYSQMARYKANAGPRMDENLAWYPTDFRWEANGGGSYDYFIVKSGFDISNEIFKEKRAMVQLVAHSGWWWLYRNNERQRGVPIDAK